MDLKEIRAEIDSIDRELVNLFLKRMELSARVAAYKIENGIPVLNATREEEIIAIVRGANEHFASYSEELYRKIFELSREYQQKLMQTKD